jgi:hypothetical protein
MPSGPAGNINRNAGNFASKSDSINVATFANIPHQREFFEQCQHDNIE